MVVTRNGSRTGSEDLPPRLPRRNADSNESPSRGSRSTRKRTRETRGNIEAVNSATTQRATSKRSRKQRTLPTPDGGGSETPQGGPENPTATSRVTQDGAEAIPRPNSSNEREVTGAIESSANSKAIDGRDEMETIAPLADSSTTREPLRPPQVAINEEPDTSSASEGFSFHDMVGKMRFFGTHLSRFIVPFPDTTAPETLVHFIALYIIRNESKRLFPKEVQVSWLTDFCISHWMQLEEGGSQQNDETTLPSVPFSEHNAHDLSILLEKRFLLFPLLADNCYSLVAIERADELLKLLKSLLRLESELPTNVAQSLSDSTLLDRVKRFDGLLSVQKLKPTTVHHLDWNAGKHDKLRNRFHAWLAQLCFSHVRGLDESCSAECLQVFLKEFISVHVPEVPDPPKEDCFTPWKVIEYLLVMLHEPEMDPDTGKLCSSEREKLLRGSLKQSQYDHLPILREIATRGIKNVLISKQHPEIDPHPGLWGNVRRSLLRGVNSPTDIDSRVILRNCLPVVLEFGLKALDDYIEIHKVELETFLNTKDALQDSTDVEKRDSLRFALSREWACKKLRPIFEEFVLVERHGLKPRERNSRFWNSVLDHISSFPPYKESAHIFRTMRSFPDSISVCLGLEYLHAKEHRIFFHQAKPPNLRHGERPWKLFDHSSKNLSRLSHWYEREAWGRMHEAGVIIFAVTEFIFRCAINTEVKTDAELASFLREIQLHFEEHESAVMRCPVNLHDIVHHVRSKKESVEQYKLRVAKRLTEAAEATKLAITCSSNAFRRALIPFAGAYSVRRGVRGLNVALCKLVTIPDNMLDLLWQNVTRMLKEILQKRAIDGGFSLSGSEQVLQYDIEAQLTRLFRAMNAVFKNNAETLLGDSFSKSRDQLRKDVSLLTSQVGAGNRKKVLKLKSLPSQNLWNFVESRYSVGYLPSTIEGSAVDDANFARISGLQDGSTTREPGLSPLHILSAKGISAEAGLTKQWEESDITPLFDPSLAMEVEPVRCINPDKTNFGWSLVTALSSILQQLPGHVQSSSCFTARHTICARKPSTLNACIDILSRVGEHVANTWCLGYGLQSLQTQSVFVRFDALMSAALAIVGSKEFACRPSIDANLCELDDERRAGNRITEETAFMGYPSEVEVIDHPHYHPGLRRSKWRGVLLHANIENLVYPEQAVQTEPDKTPALYAVRRSSEEVRSIDYIHLRNLKLPQPQVYKVSLRYFLEVPGVQADKFLNKSGELNFTVGDVFWMSMISVGKADRNGFIGGNGYSGVHLGVMMEPATTKMHYEEGASRNDRPVVHKEQVAAIIFLPQGLQSERPGFRSVLNRMMTKRLGPRPSRPGDQVIRLIPTGINIESEISTVNVTFRRTHHLPQALNLAAVHPRLLQIHTQRILTIIHRSSSKQERYDGIMPSSTPAEKYRSMLQDVSKVVEALFPRLEPEQIQAVATPLLWSSLMRSSFFDSDGNPSEDMRYFFSKHFSAESMKRVGTNVFFTRGPPGTGKSSVITSLLCAGLFGHESEEDVKGLLPKSIKRILVVTHTNAAVDDVLKKVSKMRPFKEGQLVRVGVRGYNPWFTTQNVFDRRARREQKSHNVRNARRRFPEFDLSDVINDASIVFSTFGSLQRTEFAQSLCSFDMVVIEEAGKLHEGDIILGLTQAIGMKRSPKPGHPLAVVMVGDEVQLQPYSNLDPNLRFPRLCADPFFKRFVSKCKRIPGAMDFNFPVTLMTQHRANRAIANVYSHYAYKGVIRTGARESWLKWKADEMDRRIEESNFKLRTVSLITYDGSIHSDVPGNTSTHGGNTNPLEYRLIVNICKDWCSRSRKFDNRITILSPYKAQADKIQSILAQDGKLERFYGLSTIQVYTVDSSQGLENDIIILSLVRTHSSQKQAFLDNPFRINVMLSRAREKLIIVGAKTKMSAIAPNWKRSYDIIDALAAEEKSDRESDEPEENAPAGEAAADREPERFYYGSYGVISETKVHGPIDV